MKSIDKNAKNVKFKKILISVLLVISLVIQISFLSYLFKAISPDEKKNDENVIMTYTSSGNLDYKVYLKPNDFIKKDYLESGEAYILNLIDHIQLIPVYNFRSTEKTSVTGSNKLVARLKVYYRESSDKNNNPEVLKREVVLDEKVMNFDESSYSVGSAYNLNLDYYMNILKEFQSEVRISLDGYVEVSYETQLSGKVGGASYNDKYVSEIQIPLSNSVIEIDKISNQEKTSKVYEGDLVKTNKTVMGYIIAVNLIVFLIICFLLKKLFEFTNRNEYQRVISKLLKTYDDIIVNTSTIIDIESYSIIEIDEFKEILNLSRELLLPIMNYEVEKGENTWFYVIKDKILYRYVVSASKVEEEKSQRERKSVKNNMPDFKKIFSNIVDRTKPLMEKVKDGLKKFISKVKNALSNLINKIKEKKNK